MNIPALVLPNKQVAGSQSARLLSLNSSLYLDMLRLVAALAVFLNHSKVLLFPDLRLGPVFGQARESVAVFFVLSGFVIRFVTEEKESGWASYLVARLSRIYSVALLAVALTFAVDTIGSSWDIAYYSSLDFYVPGTVGAAIQYLTFTNQLWLLHVVYGTNEPYWSLGFETWYYVFFALSSSCHRRLASLQSHYGSLSADPKLPPIFRSGWWASSHMGRTRTINHNGEGSRRAWYIFQPFSFMQHSGTCWESAPEACM